MNAHRYGLQLGALLVLASAASATGCSDDSTTGPSSHLDSGSIDTGTSPGIDAAMDAATMGDDGGGTNGDAASDSAPACISDATLCNSCSTPDAADYFYNSCGSQLTNCVPFTGTVPPHPTVQ
ncbi:MAG: hypothetical protein ABTD50_15740 [Polyangiaceae bacterium]|jgi:hypothetical protein